MPTIASVEKLVQERWVPEFHYVHHQTAPFTPFQADVHESRVALIATGGAFVKGDHPFDDHYGLGDPSYREIPSDTDPRHLSFHHEHYDPTNATRDINCMFPIERMHDLVAAGDVKALATTFYGFMGYVPITHPLTTVTAPQVARKLKLEGVDAVLLVPS